ncbi:MAG: Holliday junction resolvase [Thermoplasmata archaeon]
MGRSSSGYERELKELLQGRPESIARYYRLVPPLERGVVDRLQRAPFLVIRGAGSLGFDLVALRDDFAFPIEVKASAESTIHFSAASGRAQEQLEAYRKVVSRVGITIFYAYRRVGVRDADPWRIYLASPKSVRGHLRFVAGRMPSVETTPSGNSVLHWESGMPLHEFMNLVLTFVDRTGA